MESKHYKYWKSIEDLKRGVTCEKNHRKIYLLIKLFQKACKEVWKWTIMNTH